MRDIVYSFQVSLDGYIEDASGRIAFASPDAELHQYFNDYEKMFDTHVYGRRLYEMMQYWETADQEDEPISLSMQKRGRRLRRSSSRVRLIPSQEMHVLRLSHLLRNFKL